MVSACSSGGGYTRSPVVTAQQLDCGAEIGRVAVTLVSPAEAIMTYHGRSVTLKRDDKIKGAFYKGGGLAYANRGAFALIRDKDRTVHECAFVPRDLESD